MKPKGFTLIELMIVIMIISILAAIMAPVLTSHYLKARRAVAKSVLMEISSKQEAWFVNNKSYTRDLRDLGYASPLQIDDGGHAISPARGFYEITMVVTSVTYVISAMPINQQAHDVECGALNISHTGYKAAAGIKGSSACW